ncbi:MAG: hypothetical protein AAF798_21640 [Bacteroidota bacterium]
MKTRIINGLNILDLCAQTLLLFSLLVGLMALAADMKALIGIFLVLPFLGLWQLGASFVRMLGKENLFFVKYFGYALSYIAFLVFGQQVMGQAIEQHRLSEVWVGVLLIAIPSIAAFVYYFKTLEAASEVAQK